MRATLYVSGCPKIEFFIKSDRTDRLVTQVERITSSTLTAVHLRSCSRGPRWQLLGGCPAAQWRATSQRHGRGTAAADAAPIQHGGRREPPESQRHGACAHELLLCAACGYPHSSVPRSYDENQRPWHSPSYRECHGRSSLSSRCRASECGYPQNSTTASVASERSVTEAEWARHATSPM